MTTVQPELVDAWSQAAAIIFDFDGVLADSEPSYYQTYGEVFARHGHHIPPDEYWEYWTSKGEGAAGQIRRHGLVGIDPIAVDAAQIARYRQLCLQGRVPLFAGAAPLLQRLLAGREGGCRPTAIASNSPPDLVAAILRAGGAPVPPVVGGPGLRLKPAPDIFLAAARRLEVEPRRALVIEDSEKGIRAARTAGMAVVLVRRPLNQRFALDADFEIRGLQPLLELMDRLA
ncbi:MAG: HAD family phosphatase [Deltaproteobacteria bacterium]|nr:HAD family phosphatase [Deltaproteobacteria bacterium]